ncbi:MAG: dihydroorotate dehydrogenase [Candidatus Omnitrophota bacterium]
MKMNLKVKLGKLELPNPIVCASGTFGFGEELAGLVNYNCIGAFITKTVTLLPRAGNPPPRIYDTGCGIINSVGLENPGLDVFIKEKLPLIRLLAVKCIVSIGGNSNQEYAECLKKLDKQKGISGFEINLSCPNLNPVRDKLSSDSCKISNGVKLKKLISQSAKMTYNLTKNLRKLTKKPLFIKITPEVTDIVEIAKVVEAGGADAVSLVNTFFSLAINIETQKPYLGNVYGGYSGRAIKPLSLYRVWKAAQNVRIPVIGGGGIESANDAIEFILAGAAAVSLGTINLVDPNSAKAVLAGIKEYMRKKKIKNINELRGRLNA